jgi:hypothetical protein
MNNLSTFLNFPSFKHFWDVKPCMIWDVYSFCMEKPNVNESEQTMGFHTIIMMMPNLSKNRFWGKSLTLITSHGS